MDQLIRGQLSPFKSAQSQSRVCHHVICQVEVYPYQSMPTWIKRLPVTKFEMGTPAPGESWTNS